jgi:signal transduction histidine kinase
MEINACKMKSCAIVLLLLLSLRGYGQPDATKVENLKVKLAEAANDSVKIKTLVDLAYHLSYTDLSQAKSYSTEALDLSTKIDWSWAQSLSYGVIGHLYDVTGDYSNSLEANNKRLKVELFGQDSTKLATCYLNVGNSFIELGKFEEAYYYTKKSWDLAMAVHDTLNMAIATHNLAKIYSKIGRHDLAITNFSLSAELSEIAGNLPGPVYNNHELGNAYILSGHYGMASKHLSTALSLSKKMGIKHLTPRIYKNLGELRSLLKDNTKALVYYDSAIALFLKNQNLFGVSRAELGKSNVYAQQKKFKDASTLAMTSLKTAQKLKAQILVLQCYETLSNISEMSGNYQQALAYDKKAKLTRDSLTDINVMGQVFEGEFQMRTQRKDEEIANLIKMRQESITDLKRQELLRNIFAVIVGLTMVLLYSVYRSGRRKVQMNKLLLSHQAEIETRTKELEELNKVKDKFFSIISHDLRSPINSLAGLLDLMERNEIRADELPSLTKEMRTQFNHTKTLINNLLDWTLLQMNKVSIKKEKIGLRSLIDDNIKLLAATSTKKTNFINDVDASITALADLNMVNLVFRNLILNGIKFTDNGGVIKISAIKGEKAITVSIADNGVGIAPEVQKMLFEKTTGYSTRGTANEKGTGLGLILAKEFIERNDGKIWLESEVGKGSTFYVTLPVA